MPLGEKMAARDGWMALLLYTSGECPSQAPIITLLADSILRSAVTWQIRLTRRLEFPGWFALQGRPVHE